MSVAPARNPRYPDWIDRKAVLDRTDLAALADELLGGHTGGGRSAKWPSPVPGHPQTGETPPMSVFRTRNGDERWTCFATGASGTAIDLVMVVTGRSFTDALEWLAGRAGVRPEQARPPLHVDHRPIPPTPPKGVHPRLRWYVSTCERWLWQPDGQAALDWLTAGRGFDPEVLRANRVGFDPGPDKLTRPRGLPARGGAVVLPVVDAGGKPIYYQARYLDTGSAGRKYDNPPAWIAPNPKLAFLRPARAHRHACTLVVEGLPDGLAAATAGFDVAAVLGTSSAGGEVASALCAVNGPLVVAFDRDDAGHFGARRLVDDLARAGRAAHLLKIPAPYLDLNEWICGDPAGLEGVVMHALDRQRLTRVVPQPSVGGIGLQL